MVIVFPLTEYPLLLLPLFPEPDPVLLPFPPIISSSPPDEQASSMVTPKKANATVGQTFFKNYLLLFFIVDLFNDVLNSIIVPKN